MIELYLSSDGKHTVHATAETPERMSEIVSYARALYDKVLADYGTKPQLWEAAKNGHTGRNGVNGQANGHVQYGKRVDTPQQAQEAFAPQCPVHGVPMKYRQGKRGPFWSCAEKLPDGSWCNQTQQVARPTNGQASSPSLHAQA